jgi:uncharacterized protein
MSREQKLKAAPLNKMRRPEYACDDTWIREFLSQAQVGHISTEWEGQPFINPTLFWYDPDQHEIYFHSNIIGRIRTNVEQHNRVCFEASRSGKLLPSNVALEFSLQYESVIAFGQARIIEDPAEARRVLYGLINKYFPEMAPGKEYRPITDQELARTTVYAVTIESWSGKRNWKEQAKQSREWASLDKKWL